MNTGENYAALAYLMHLYGINEVVVSPGSRNAPIIHAIEASNHFRATVIVDERSAAFVALGKALVSREPIALVCTSGSALLNYAPAIAEAYYRNVPLLVISADRPHGIIDRNEPQTIKQPGVYNNFIKKSFNVNVCDDVSLTQLIYNDAIAECKRIPQGPVHINVEIENPTVSHNPDYQRNDIRRIECLEPSLQLSKNTISEIAQRLQSPTRVMIVVGDSQPSQKINRAISKLCTFGNFAAIVDATSNLHGKGIFNCPETIFSGLNSDEKKAIKPQIVITHGGPIISDKLKQFISETNAEHWHIGITSNSCDTFHKLSTRINTEPEEFYVQLVSTMRRSDISSDYGKVVKTITDRVINSAKEFIASSQWSDLTAITTILLETPADSNVQLSNGMTVRYGQLLPTSFHRVDCNRGVSGIEGSTSTAIGAASEFNGRTVLISGDMSAFYDIAGLLLPIIPPNFKMIIINNGGGGIFKYIAGTRTYHSVDKYMYVDRDYSFDDIAKSAKFQVYHAHNVEELKHNYKVMLKDDCTPSLMIVHTRAEVSADAMHRYINRII